MKEFKKAQIVFITFISLVLCGCSVVSLQNKTNHVLHDNLGISWTYYSDDIDVFRDGPPYVFHLLVRRDRNVVSYESIKPKIYLNGTYHDMTLMTDWVNNMSIWSYEITESCVDVGSVPDYGFKYHYRIHYPWPNPMYQRPPKRSPVFHARVFGAGTFHFSPFPHGITSTWSEPTITYSQQCWDTNYGCTTPTYSLVQRTHAQFWPGPASRYEYELKLRNLTNGPVTLTDYILRQSYENFKIIMPKGLPQTIACGDSYSFILRYKPGYDGDPDFIPGTYRAFATISTLLKYEDNTEGWGPALDLDFTFGIEPN